MCVGQIAKSAKSILYYNMLFLQQDYGYAIFSYNLDIVTHSSTDWLHRTNILFELFLYTGALKSYGDKYLHIWEANYEAA